MTEQLHTKLQIVGIILSDMQVLHSSNFTPAKNYLHPLKLVFLRMEEAWTSLISILLQLATDASLLSTNPNCTWWAKLIGWRCLTFLQLWAKTFLAFFKIPSKHPRSTLPILNVIFKLTMSSYIKNEENVGDHKIAAVIAYQPCLVLGEEHVCFSIEAI